MKSFMVFLIGLLLSLPAMAQKKADLKALDAYLAKAIKDWNVPGMAVAIVKDDSVIFSKGYGTRTIGKNEPVDSHTLFAIASLSKAFTTACLGQLVEQGKLHWDDKVTDHLPYFQMYDPYVTREMTVRDLLCHRSGSATFGGDLIWYGTNYSRDEVVRRVRYLKPTYSFRSHYGYQNIMFITAGELFPVLTGKTWDEYVRENIFKPLGMHETNTSVRALEGNPNVATPHTTWNGQAITVPYRNVDNAGADAAINSNVHDLAKWIRVWLSPDTSTWAVSASTRYELWTPHTLLPITVDASKRFPSTHFRAAALGWFTFDYEGRKIIDHGGGMDGMISKICLVPEENLGFIILTNSISSLSSAIEYSILDAFITGSEKDWSREYLNLIRASEAKEKADEQKLEHDRVKNTQSSLPLASYAGVYGGPMYGHVKITAEGNGLNIQFLPTASFKGRLTHWHYDTFRIELEDRSLPKGLVNFILDKNGNVSEMKIDIPNPDFDFTELELKKLPNDQ
ncbi:serine hydrolase [bacterium]|nr:serine hydrolase [bacterium]